MPDRQTPFQKKSDGIPAIGPERVAEMPGGKGKARIGRERLQLRDAVLADEYLAASSVLFSEWNSPEDEEAFRDL